MHETHATITPSTARQVLGLAVRAQRLPVPLAQATLQQRSHGQSVLMDIVLTVVSVSQDTSRDRVDLKRRRIAPGLVGGFRLLTPLRCRSVRNIRRCRVIGR